MEWIRTGRAWLFGDNILGDTCVGADTFQQGITDPNVLRQRFMVAYDPDFPEKVRDGDFVVAGSNFGAGRTHPEFYIGVKAVGLGGIIADSVQRMVVRGAAERGGILVMSCPHVSKEVNSGDELRVNFKTGELTNLTRDVSLWGTGITGSLAEIYEAGGMMQFLKKKIERGEVAATIRSANDRMKGDEPVA